MTMRRLAKKAIRESLIGSMKAFLACCEVILLPFKAIGMFACLFVAVIRWGFEENETYVESYRVVWSATKEVFSEI